MPATNELANHRAHDYGEPHTANCGLLATSYYDDRRTPDDDVRVRVEPGLPAVARRDIPFDARRKLPCELRAIHEHAHFRIQVGRTRVEIERADVCDAIVDDHALGM